MPPPLVIIPAFNEAQAIGPVVAKVLALGFHVVVVDDCSQDNTRKVAETAGGRVLRHPTNLGYGCALQTGYLYALQKGYPRVVQLDGDGQHDPEHVQDLLLALETGGCDVVIGSRFLGLHSYRVSRLRRMGQRFFGLLLNRFTGWRITDPTSGFQALNAEVLRFYCSRIFPDDFPDANVILLLRRKGFKVMEIPVRMFASQTGSMHSGLVRPVYYLIKMTLSFFMSLLIKLPTEPRK
ncbi:MAG: glycosyltransferase family 2 protein [Magnetococcales bacterium]|nr:glycosyltransferase family 2 protein [Magnetococcales bacterium]